MNYQEAKEAFNAGFNLSETMVESVTPNRPAHICLAAMLILLFFEDTQPEVLHESSNMIEAYKLARTHLQTEGQH